MRAAVIGLGEAGAIYASTLADAGHHVVGYDPFVEGAIPGVGRAKSIADAVEQAAVVLVLTAAGAATIVAAEAFPGLGPGTLYVDMTSSAPDVMERLGASAPEGAFVDVAILGPVIALRSGTPLIVSGQRSAEAATLLASLGAPVTDVAGTPGDATARKLVRSVAGKGLAAVVCEAMDAARAAGFEEWMRDEVARLLPGDGRQVIDRYESGTRKHAVRRGEELDAVAAYLACLGVPADMSVAAARLHHRYAEEVGS